MKKIIFSIIWSLVALASFAQASHTTTALNLRDAPNGRAMTVIPQNAVLEIGDCQSGWCETSYHGQSGYVSQAYVKSGEPQTIQTNQAQATSPVHYYTNTNGNKVQSPTQYNSQPAGATAQCNDGTYSFSQHHRGTCSHHGGVARWL